MKSTVHIEIAEGVDPFVHNTSRTARARFREYIGKVKALIGEGLVSRGTTRPTAIAGTALAVGTATAAAVAGADTVTLNGTALTATQHNSRGTATFSTIVADNTVTVQGVTFTAKVSPSGANQFALGASDTEAAANLAAAINAHTTLTGVVTATSAAAVVTIRAVVAGTGGDAITLAKVGAPITLSAATLAGGAAIANNQFDFGGSNAETATALAAAVNASTTGVIDDVLAASNFAATITLASVAAGEWVAVAGTRFTAVGAASGTLTEFAISGTDTQDAAALVVVINAHPSLRDLVFASSSSGVVTVRQRPPAPTSALRLSKVGAGITLSGSALAATAVVLVSAVTKGKQGNANTLASSDGTRLAVSGARLTGGTQSAFTF